MLNKHYFLKCGMVLCTIIMMSTLLWNGQIYAQTNDESMLKENAKYKIVDGNYIARVLPNTSVEQFKKQLSNTNVTIYNNSTKSQTITSGIIKTGMVVNNGTTDYTISVIGDVNSDGLLNQIDIRELIHVIIGTKTDITKGEIKKSLDINNDTATDQRDLTKMIRYVIYGKLGVPEEEENNNPGDDKPIPPPTTEDKTAPTIQNVSFSTTEWTNQKVTITASAQDAQTGIVAYQIGVTNTPDANNWKTVTATKNPITLTINVTGNGTYYVFVKDQTGNIATKTIEVTNIDTKVPALEVKTGEITTQSVQVQVNASDDQSGIAVTKFAQGNHDANYFASEGSSFTGSVVALSADGIYTFYAKDRAGNVAVKTIEIAKKVEAQKFAISKIEGAATNLAYIKGETTEFTIISGRAGKIDTSKIRVSGAANYETQVLANGNVVVKLTASSTTGEMNVSIGEGFITDNNGNYNQEMSVGPFYVDNSGPTITSFATTRVTDTTVRIAVKATDVGKSGLASKETYTYYISRSSNFSNATVKTTTDAEYTFSGLEAGQRYYFKVVVKDNNGNTSTSNTINTTTTGTPVDLQAISFGNITWENGLAAVVIEKENSNTKIQYAITDKYGKILENWQETTNSRYTLRYLENDWIIRARLVDNNGNVGEYVTLHILDDIRPEAGSVKMTTVDDGLSYRVYNGDTVGASVLVEVQNGYDDESGHLRTRYTITGPENIYNAREDTILTKNGTYRIVVTTEDYVGNTSTRTYTITIDKKNGNNNNNTTNKLTLECTSPTGFKYINTGDSYTFTLKTNRPVQLVDKYKAYVKTGVAYNLEVTGYGTDWKVKVTAARGTGTIDVEILPGMFIDNYGNLTTEDIALPRIWVQ